MFVLGILAIGLINEALDEGDAQKTLQALQIPAAKLEGVTPRVAQHYQDVLLRCKREKAQVSWAAAAVLMGLGRHWKRLKGLGVFCQVWQARWPSQLGNQGQNKQEALWGSRVGGPS